jgi:peptide/nickel transport system substrate-binding protein
LGNGSIDVRGTLSAAAFALAALAGCSAHRDDAHWLRIASGQGDPNSLNIHLDPSALGGYISELTAAYFARYDKTGHPVPELLTVIPTQANGGISRDGKTIVWHLRRGVRWSDGAPFSADDVVFSVKTILNPANDEEQGTAGWDQIARMDEPDKNTVIFHLKAPYGSYLPLYFGTAADEPCILPKHILGSLPTINDAPYNRKPIGIGPFRVVEWKHGDAIELEANPYYWRGKPKLARITYKLLPSQETVTQQMQTGEVDLWPLMPPSYTARLQHVPRVRVLVEPNYRTTNLDFVVANRPLVADVRVRQAVRYAIDRRKLIATVLHGLGYIHDGVTIPLDPPKLSEPGIPFDPTRARALLDAAGWRAGDGGIRVRAGQRLTLEAVYPVGAAELDQSIEFIRAELRAVGIGVESKRYAPNVFRALVQNGGILYGGKYDFAVYPRTLEAVSDVNGLYGCKTIPPNGENATRYCNPQVDRLLSATEASYDQATRRRLFANVQAHIIADAPTIVLFVWKGGYAWNRRVTGFDPPILTPFDDMMNVDVR